MEIKFELSESSIKKAREKLDTYKDGLKGKCEKLCRELSQDGISVAESYISESPLGKTITVRSDITEEEAGCKAIVVATGQTMQTQKYPPFNTLLAVEFGAGIHYNRGTENPKAAEFSMGVGTFPNQRFAKNDTWWYKGNDGHWHPSHGVKATMPMYHAVTEMKDKIMQVAKEVFKD